MDYPRRHLLQRSAALGALAVPLPTAPARAADPPGDILFAQPGAFIPVTGTRQRFQVRRIYCVGRNYAAHAIERGSDPTREPPFFFQKPTDAIQTVAQGVTVDHPYPPVTKSDLSKMIWDVAEQVSHLSQYYELFAGDIIYCGTPENVGPVVPGDLMQGHIDGLYDINVKVV